MVGWSQIVLNIDRGLFRLEEEFTGASDTEAIIGGLSVSSDLDGILVNDVLVGIGIALFIVDIPAEGFPEGVKEFATNLGFVITTGFVVVDVFGKMVAET